MSHALKWLAGFSRTRGSRGIERRLHMPERLESRNAPGNLLPMLPTFAESLEVDLTPQAVESQPEECQKSDFIYGADEFNVWGQENTDLLEILRAEELTTQINQAKLQTVRQATEFLPSVELAARAEAFGSLLGNQSLPTLLPSSLVPPPVIHPVEPIEQEPGESVPAEVPPPVIQPVITDPDSEHNQLV